MKCLFVKLEVGISMLICKKRNEDIFPLFVAYALYFYGIQEY